MTTQAAMTTALNKASADTMLRMAAEMEELRRALQTAAETGVGEASEIAPAWFNEAMMKKGQGDVPNWRAFFEAVAEEHAARLAEAEVHYEGGVASGAAVAAQLGVDLKALELTSWEGIKAAVQGRALPGHALPLSACVE